MKEILVKVIIQAQLGGAIYFSCIFLLLLVRTSDLSVSLVLVAVIDHLSQQAGLRAEPACSPQAQSVQGGFDLAGNRSLPPRSHAPLTRRHSSWPVRCGPGAAASVARWRADVQGFCPTSAGTGPSAATRWRMTGSSPARIAANTTDW